ncbi:MAG: hypothetical protein JWO01_2334 [Microbacteriaceae bacterium]|jgi:hypothetical protein|nr:hypothetical protein [Microbacteriaceae bacterium]
MGTDGFGSSIVIALAALLWLVYLVPTWFRRREYLSTERNAVRLQQTLRVLAETAEVPHEVRVETSARSAAAQEQILRKQLKHQDAVARAQAAAADRAASRELAQTLPRLAADVRTGSTATRRLRRSRAFTSFVLLASLVAAGFGVGQWMTSASWFLLASGSVVAIGSFALLGQMAAVGRARAELVRGLRAQSQAQTLTAPRLHDQAQGEQAAESTGWTPVPVPKPLYLSRPQIDRAVAASLDAAAELRNAAAEAERRLREAHESPEVTPIIRPAAPIARPAAVQSAKPSRFAGMGYLGEIEGTTTDLDAVLQRRRASAAS